MTKAAAQSRDRFGRFPIDDAERAGTWRVVNLVNLRHKHPSIRYTNATGRFGTRYGTWHEVACAAAEDSWFDRNDPLYVRGLTWGDRLYVRVESPAGKQMDFTINISFVPSFSAYDGLRAKL